MVRVNRGLGAAVLLGAILGLGACRDDDAAGDPDAAADLDTAAGRDTAGGPPQVERCHGGGGWAVLRLYTADGASTIAEVEATGCWTDSPCVPGRRDAGSAAVCAEVVLYTREGGICAFTARSIHGHVFSADARTMADTSVTLRCSYPLDPNYIIEYHPVRYEPSEFVLPFGGADAGPVAPDAVARDAG